VLARRVGRNSGDGWSSTVGCNRIAGKPTINGTQITFGPMAATRIACFPPLDQLEHQYLCALAAVPNGRRGPIFFAGNSRVTIGEASSPQARPSAIITIAPPTIAGLRAQNAVARG
jgi:hypothetical protein